MPAPKFAPGFRLSVIDVFILVMGAIGIGSATLWTMNWWWGFVVAFVVAHFFLFCNVIRASRPLELAWGGVCLLATTATIMWDFPGWSGTIAASLVTTTAVVVLEMRKVSYHGIGWQKINPDLPAWWVSHNAEAKKVQKQLAPLRKDNE